MTYRINPIDVPDDRPFLHDKLDRSKVVDFVAGIVEQAAGAPMVLAVDGPYGSGKSTFVRMLQAVLGGRGYQTVYFDAWKADHITDPLVALVAELDTAIPKDVAADQLSAQISKVKKMAGVLGKRAIIAGIKIGTAGIIDIPADMERSAVDGVGDAAKDLIEIFQAETKLIENFRTSLQDTVACLRELEKKSVLVYFIDELDRCRPDFAITLLERVKHMFDVANVVFILSVDKAQLEGATAAVYGDRINTVEYLRKFIDLEFSLPVPSARQFIDATITRSNMDETFSMRLGDAKNDRAQFIRFFAMLADMFQISLRTQERCILRLKLVLEQTVDHEMLYPAHLALLLVLRMVNVDFFWEIVNGKKSPTEIEEFLLSQPKSNKFVGTQEWTVLEAILIAEDRHEARRAGAVSQLEGQLNRDERRIASQKLTIINGYSNYGMEPGGVFDLIAKKIDLASRVT